MEKQLLQLHAWLHALQQHQTPTATRSGPPPPQGPAFATPDGALGGVRDNADPLDPQEAGQSANYQTPSNSSLDSA
ncbi:unnamed protein product [Protopolystoma xenopodis]|uniref:Uncharacterized protein n=1 Tax=Protopolystoma xenopodis TaxID=117903 RepID=A0A3S4ZXW5_9PLAT|nr:unnamed protein product [Protopolystoma xenopodis]